MIREVSTYIWDPSFTSSVYNLFQSLDVTIIPATKLEPKIPVGRQEWSSNELKKINKCLSISNKHYL